MGKGISFKGFHIKKEIAEKGKQVISRTAETVKKMAGAEKAGKPDIQVMMLGARRVGKTSILASMSNLFLEVTKDTNLILTKENGGAAIEKALKDMKSFFDGNPEQYERLQMMDTNATQGFDFFDLKLSIAGKKDFGFRKIRFKDCAGEWISNYDANKEQMAEEIEQSDVIIIAIDSVLLMEENITQDKIGKYNSQNAVDNVTTFIKENMNPDDNMNSHKMVLFVPLKCEKYYWGTKDKDNIYYERGMTDLNKAVKKAYKELFDFFNKPAIRPYFDVAILPILTIGGIQFYEFTSPKDAKRICTEDMTYEYCIPLPHDNASRATYSRPVFAPYNCEQPLIYALLFEYDKIKKEYEAMTYKKNGKKKISATFKEWIQDKKELAKDTDYTTEIEKLKKLQKKNGDGIDIIQGVFF